MMNLKKVLITTIVGLLVTNAASASVILSTEFTDIAGDPTKIVWVENGISVTNELEPKSLIGLNSISLFPNSVNTDAFGVDLNIHNEDSWFVDIATSVGQNMLNLDSLSFDSRILNNSGGFQVTQRDLTFSLDIINSLGTILFSNSIQVFDGDNLSNRVNPVRSTLFDLSSIDLLADGNYTLRLIASGEGAGSNAGFDNFLLSGTASLTTPQNATSVSSPASTSLLIASLGFLVFCKRRKK